MIRKLRTQRDNQQWMLDLALNMRGRVQNFERDDLEVPQGKRARNYRMLPKVWREAAERHEALAKRAQARGANATATAHYDHAIEAYRMAQHPIYYDNHPVKKYLYRKLTEMVDRRSEVADYPIERVEVPFDDGKTISCLLHLLPDRRKAPVVIYVPGMDQTKEVFPRPRTTSRSRAAFTCSRWTARAGQLEHAEDPRGGRQLRARGCRGHQLSAQRPEVDPTQDRDLRHQHGKLLVAAAFELRPSRRRGGELGRVLQPEQHDLHAVLAALQADVHVHGGLRERAKVRRGSRERHDGARAISARSNARRCS